MAKYYLDPDGVRILVRNFNNSLDQKMDKFDLNEYASKDYVENIVDNLEISADTSEIERKIAQLEGSVNGIYHYKGSVDNREALGNIANPAVGDVYNIADSGMNVAWTEEGWDDFGSTDGGIVLLDSNKNRWKITVNTNGELISTQLS